MLADCQIVIVFYDSSVSCLSKMADDTHMLDKLYKSVVYIVLFSSSSSSFFFFFFFLMCKTNIMSFSKI